MKRTWAWAWAILAVMMAGGNALRTAVPALAQGNVANDAALNVPPANAAVNTARAAGNGTRPTAGTGNAARAANNAALNTASPANNAARATNNAAAASKGNSARTQAPAANAAASPAATNGANPSFAGALDANAGNDFANAANAAPVPAANAAPRHGNAAAPANPPPANEAIPTDMPAPEPGISEPLGAQASAAGGSDTSRARPERLRASVQDPEISAYEEQASQELRQRIKRDLDAYCMDYCTVLSIEVSADEVFETVNADLGFEGATTGPGASRRFRVREAQAEILIDTRFGSENIARIAKLFERITPRYEKPLTLAWTKVTFPETASTQKSEAEVRGEFASQVRHQMERTIAQFCPTECKLNALDVQVARASMDEAERGAVQRYLFARDGRGALFVRGVQASLSIHSGMDAARRSQIASVLRESLLPFGSVSLDITSVAFPRPADEIQKDLDEARRDPYGLDKIAALMKLFRENMVGKEVYKETNTRESASSQSTQSTEAREKSQSSSSVRENEQSTQQSSRDGLRESNSTTSPWTLVAAFAGILLLVTILGALWLRRFLNSAAMREVLAPHGVAPAPGGQGEAQPREKAEPTTEGRLHVRLEAHNVQQEILEVFVASPKASRDVFTRILREDGIALAAKYVSIFGEIVVYELLRDLDLKDDLNTLAEYVHQNAPQVDEKERLELLRQLKLKLTAAKVKLLANRTLDVFDFLKVWSPRQIYELARDEAPSVQGIILTQLNPEKRRGVFELFNDDAKTKLLQALSQIDMMPREYLIGTAQFLKTKAQRNPIFDAENVRGTEVLMDLLAKAEAGQQRALVAQLDASNPQASWMVRNSLVTAETLLFVRENILLDMLLDMDPTDMAVFLAGSSEHVRNGIFGRIPRDISANWAESMSEMGKVEAEAYRMAEAKIFSKVRQWASKGALSLAEINEKVYPRDKGNGQAPGPEVARRSNVA